MNKQNLKIRSIIDPTGTCFYNLSEFFAEYLQPFATNQYTIVNTQTFPSFIGNIPPLQPDEKDVSYDIESLFTNVPVKETIAYITKTVYEDKKFSPFYTRQVFYKLLLEFTTKNLFTVLQQIDGVSMERPLSI